MKRILLVIGFLCSMDVFADDYVHLMTTHEKCTQWGERGKQIAAQFYAGDSIQNQYNIIDSTGGDTDTVTFQKKQIDVIYNSLPKTDNVYDQIMYASNIAKAMYDQCESLYEKH